jgi:rubrerythrin
MKRVIPAYKTLVDILQDAIDKENDAEQYYTEAAELAQNAEVREFLLDMARMEKEHALMLARRLDSLRADQTVIDGILSSYDEEPAEGGPQA